MNSFFGEVTGICATCMYLQVRDLRQRGGWFVVGNILLPDKVTDGLE